MGEDRQSVRAWFARMLGVVLALAGPSGAFAAAGSLTTEVTPLTDAVTYSNAATGLQTYVGYRVAIANGGGNTINNILFTGTAAVTDTDEKAVFFSAEGASCTTTNAAQTAIQCSIGRLTAGQSFPAFVVFFKAPQKDTVSPLPNGDPAQCNTTDCVNFAGTTLYAEQSGGVPNSKPQNSTLPWSAAGVPLGTFNPTLVKSALPKSGGKLFTGNGGVSTGQDPFTTSVVVPPAQQFTTAVISEAPDGGVNCSNFLTCYRSSITIPGTFSPYLAIVLREDASNINSGTKIESVLITYIDAANVSHDVGLCASPTTPLTNGIPCIASRVYYKSNKVPGWTPNLDGDFEWTLINISNGGYIVR